MSRPALRLRVHAEREAELARDDMIGIVPVAGSPAGGDWRCRQGEGFLDPADILRAG
jgi:hypothetical protein